MLVLDEARKAFVRSQGQEFVTQGEAVSLAKSNN